MGIEWDCEEEEVSLSNVMSEMQSPTNATQKLFYFISFPTYVLVTLLTPLFITQLSLSTAKLLPYTFYEGALILFELCSKNDFYLVFVTKFLQKMRIKVKLFVYSIMLKWI